MLSFAAYGDDLANSSMGADVNRNNNNDEGKAD